MLELNEEALTRNNESNNGPNTISKRAMYLVMSFLCIIVFLASWVSCFGWFRIVFALPMLIHAVIFCFANIYYCKYNYAGKKIRFINYFVYITYLLFYILLPDMADDAMNTVAVFGLVKNSAVINTLGDVSGLLFTANIILIICQIVYSAIDRHKMKRVKRERNDKPKRERLPVNTPKAVTVNAVMGKIASIAGYVVGVPSLIIIIVGLTDLESKGAATAVEVFIVILAICIFSIYKGVQIKKLISRFIKYDSIILANTTSLESIAANTSQSVDFVRTDLQKMINKNFFVSAYIDMNANEIIINGRIGG